MAEWRNRIIGEGEEAPANLMEAANPNNPRLHPDRQEQVLEDILDKVGYVDRVLVNKRTGRLIDGHLRVKMALAKGGTSVPVEYVDLSPEEEKLVLATFDPIAGLAEFDPEILKGLSESVKLDFDFDLSGVFDEGEFETIVGNGSGETEGQDVGPQIDRAEELRQEWGTELGQLWQIESKANPDHYHRLICGDCRDKETMERLTQGKSVNGVFTSPPYAMQRTKQYGGVATAEYVDWWEAVQENVRTVLAEDGSFFVNIKPHCEDGQRVLYVFDLVLAMARRWGWRFVDELCWKHQGIMGKWDNRFKNRFEPIFHFSVGKKIKLRHQNVIQDFSKNTRVFQLSNYDGINNAPAKTGSPFRQKAKKSSLFDGALPSNLIEVANTITSGHSGSHHAATFPLKLPTFFIKAYSDPADIWLDPFAGSGTVGIAAENEGRLSMMVEKLPKYCAVILQRYVDIFGVRPELISNTCDNIKKWQYQQRKQ